MVFTQEVIVRYSFPITANAWALAGIFVGALIVLHLWLVRWKKLDKRAWKKTDYIWLSLTALGLIGEASHAREIVAKNYLVNAKLHQRWIRDRIMAEISSDAKNDGGVCKVLVRDQVSLSSAEYDKQKQAYDEACSWARKVYALASAAENQDCLDTSSWPKAPTNPRVSILIPLVNYFIADNAQSNAQVQKYKELEEDTTPEMIVKVISPLLLAFALALRITKVTGEIKLEAPPKT
jgi:hypothetical protein